MCLSGAQLDAGQADQFREFSRLLQSLFHHEFHALQEKLKNAYAPVNPDADTREVELNTQEGCEPFIDLLESLLDRANYEKVSDADLQQALLEESMFKIRLQVDFDDYAEVLLFCRGQSVREETVVSWFGLRARNIRFTNFDRVVVYLKFRDDFNPVLAQLPENRAGATLLKLFQNVPKADLEMLFPNTRVRMRTMDKLLIGVPALVSGGVVIATKLGTTLVLIGSLIGYWIGIHQEPVELNRATVIALLAGLGALGAYLWKQISNFRNRKLRFMQALTRNLYFKNLDNNAGVFLRLINDAEEEECKEAVLVDRWQASIDFEIDDALDKLVRLQLVEYEDEHYRAVNLAEAVTRLDVQWDNYFTA